MKTPDLLNEAKSRFVVLYHDDAVALNGLLKQALGKYQDKAGVLLSLRWEKDADGSTVRALPPNFLDVAVACDSHNNYVPVEVDTATATMAAFPGADTAWPITVRYYADLREWPVDTELPPVCVSLVLDYLVALIDRPNTERARATAAATGMQAQDFPMPQELMDRITLLEQAMEENQALVPPVVVY